MSTTCRVEGCDREAPVKGGVRKSSWCHAHKKRLQIYGDVRAHLPIRRKAPNGSGSIDSYGYAKDYLPEHPLAHKDGQVMRHRRVLFDALGPGTHPCHWCSQPVTWSEPFPLGLQPDHLNGDRADNRRENLVPSCVSCNSRRRNAGNPIDWQAVI